MENIKKNIKKAVSLVFAGAVLLTALDYYLCREKKKRWNIIWDVSSSSFHVSGKKTAPSKKSRKSS